MVLLLGARATSGKWLRLLGNSSISCRSSRGIVQSSCHYVLRNDNQIERKRRSSLIISDSRIITREFKSTSRIWEKEESRTRTITKAVKNALTEKHENIYNVPNLLTFSRLVAAPVCGYSIIATTGLLANPWITFTVFCYACLTDFVDGYIARKFKMHTVVGTVIDPMADKLLMLSVTAACTYTGQMPIWLTTIIIGRDVLLGFSAIYYRYISLPPPKTLVRFFDFSLPSAEVHPTTISKVNTALQMLLVAAYVIQPVILDQSLIPSDIVTYIPSLQYLVATTTVLSGLSYLFSKTAVKILKRP